MEQDRNTVNQTAPEERNGCCPEPVNTISAPLENHPELQFGASCEFQALLAADMVYIRGGFSEMGTRRSRYAQDRDGPPRRVAVSDFSICRFAITNHIFARFVEETGYRTTAEREGWSFVFEGHLDRPEDYKVSPPHTPWWRQVHGACWKAPEGARSGLDTRENHPVTHVSWHDAVAFCQFTGMRLPREAEWEFAARGGLKQAKYPWGNASHPEGAHRHNVWQGQFPKLDTAEDGYAGTSPVDAFAPNGFGLHNMTGNVWEWCADWFGGLPPKKHRPLRDPKGPDQGPGRVTRGGSFMCHESYCERYFVHSRTFNTSDSSTSHTGFRVVLGTREGKL